MVWVSMPHTDTYNLWVVVHSPCNPLTLRTKNQRVVLVVKALGFRPLGFRLYGLGLKFRF